MGGILVVLLALFALTSSHAGLEEEPDGSLRGVWLRFVTGLMKWSRRVGVTTGEAQIAAAARGPAKRSSEYLVVVHSAVWRYCCGRCFLGYWVLVQRAAMEGISITNNPAFSALKFRHPLRPLPKHVAMRYAGAGQFPFIPFYYWLVDRSSVCNCSKPAAEAVSRIPPIEMLV